MLDISPILLLSSVVIFLMVVFRLNSCLFKPLLKHMDDRALSIKEDLKNAKSNSADVDSMLAEANDVIAKAKKEATAIRDKAYDEAKSIADEKLFVCKEELESKYEKFTKELQNETKMLKESLSASMPQFKESIQVKLNSI